MIELADESELRVGLRALEREADLPSDLINRALIIARAHRNSAGSSVTAGALSAPGVGIGTAEVARAIPPGRPWRRVAPALAALMVAAVVATILLITHNGKQSTQSAGTPAPLAVRIELDQTSVHAGTPITGRAIITNNTGHALVIADCHGVWLQVGLAGGAISNVPGWLDCLTVPGTKLPVGTITMPITVATTYNECTQQARSATAHDPACVRGAHGAASMPPLPPGSYSTETAILAPDGIPMPTSNTVGVTLTP